MIIITFIFIICLLYYRIFHLYTWSWKRIPSNIKINSCDAVSVIVACRNEENNIISLIDDIRNQNFHKERFEMIVVDDHSEDTTLELLQQEEKRWSNLTVISMNETEEGKRSAIKRGISIANGEIILCTDADCRIGRNWIRTIVNYFAEDSVLFVSSPVEYIPRKGLFQKFQYLEFLSLVASGAAAISRKKPLFCNGANLGFRKQVFNQIDEKDFLEFSTDDVSILHYINNNNFDAIRFVKDKEAVVRTKSHSSYLPFFNQKIRWINSSRNEQNVNILHVASIVFIMNLLIVVFFSFTLFNKFLDNELIIFLFSKYILLGLFLFKFISDFRFIFPVLGFFQKRSLAIYILPFEIIYSFYTSLIVPLSFLYNVKWKKRSLS